MTTAAAPQKLVKTRIIATLGPASESIEVLRQLVAEGVDIFRLNFAHGSHAWLGELVRKIRQVSTELERPVGILGDLSGPKIRLGELPGGELHCTEGSTIRFVRGTSSDNSTHLTCTYEPLIDDVRPGDKILLADGTVSLQVTERSPTAEWVECKVIEGGVIRSRQGVNLPGVALSTPSVTEKDRRDLEWALQQNLDFIGLSFVRKAADILHLQSIIASLRPRITPLIVAKI